MFGATRFLARLVEHMSKFDPLFSYLPEFYLETVIDSFHALRRGDPPPPFTEGAIVTCDY